MIQRPEAVTGAGPEAGGRPRAARRSAMSERDVSILRSLADRIDPGDAGAHNNLGVLFFQKGLFDDAVAAFERALELDPRLEVARQNAEIAFKESGHFEERVRSLRDGSPRRPRQRRQPRRPRPHLPDGRRPRECGGRVDGAAPAVPPEYSAPHEAGVRGSRTRPRAGGGPPAGGGRAPLPGVGRRPAPARRADAGHRNARPGRARGAARRRTGSDGVAGAAVPRSPAGGDRPDGGGHGGAGAGEGAGPGGGQLDRASRPSTGTAPRRGQNAGARVGPSR